MKIRPNALMIVQAGERILVQRFFDLVKQEEFHRVLGGGIEFGETGEEAVRREFKEELNTEISNLEFLEVHENIFQYNEKYGHEITFLYKGDIHEKFQSLERVSILDNEGAYAEWIDVKDVIHGKKIVYPESVKIFL